MNFETKFENVKEFFLMRWNFHLFSYNFNSKMKDFKNIIIKSFGQFFYEEFIFLTDSQYFKIKYLKNGKKYEN